MTAPMPRQPLTPGARVPRIPLAALAETLDLADVDPAAADVLGEITDMLLGAE